MEVIEEKDEVILGTESPIPDSLVDQDFQITNVCSLQEEDPYDPQIQGNLLGVSTTDQVWLYLLFKSVKTPIAVLSVRKQLT